MSAPHWIHDLITEQIALKAANSTENIELLNEIKKYFYDEIGSVRRYECINTFEDLLQVLESRGTFMEQDICTTKQNINMIDLNAHVLETRATFMEKQICAGMQNINIIDSNAKDEEYGPEIYHHKRKNIHDVISTVIGDNWIDFGLHLNISKHVLDNLKVSHTDNCKTMKRMIEIYESQEENNEEKIIGGICHALTACKCNDICQYVQSVFCR